MTALATIYTSSSFRTRISQLSLDAEVTYSFARDGSNYLHVRPFVTSQSRGHFSISANPLSMEIAVHSFRDVRQFRSKTPQRDNAQQIATIHADPVVIRGMSVNTNEVHLMVGPMIPRERCDYSAIVDRPPLKLPGNARIVFWTIVNYEVWDIAKPMARQLLPAPTGVPLMPDVVHWGFHEYGMRVGCWRFFELYKKLGIKPTLAANARICEDYPRVAEEAKRAGWEFMGHAYEQGPIHKETDQAGMINRTMDIMQKFTGKRPVGWLGPGLTQTLDTPENLAAAGVKYIGDWVYDDEPTVICTAKGPLVTLPYTLELNDIPMMMIQHHESDYLYKRAVDQFDRLYAESKNRAKFVALAIHPYISGQPHRIKYLEAIYDYVNKHEGVLHWNGEQILNWYHRIANAQKKAAE